MRILMPTGTVETVERAIAVCELRSSFNGRDERLCESARDIAHANGIAFFPEMKAHEAYGMVTNGAVLFGNLPNRYVREVLDSLVKKGYADLSGLTLQDKQPQAVKYTFDNGESDAYLLTGYEVDASCWGIQEYPFVIGADAAASEPTDAGEED